MKILLTSTLLAAAFFQAPAKPPMKMGLWEMKGTSKIQQADGSEKATSHLYRNCITESNWLKMMGPTAPDACPKANEAWSKNDYSFDVACSGKPKMATASVHFDSPELQHGTINIYAMPDGAPMKLSGDFEGRWIKSACGDVSPDHPVLVR